MKCQSNKIGEWLDRAYIRPESHITMERNAYNAAMEVLEVAGFKVDTVPCGRGMIHIVNPPDKIVKSDGCEVTVDGLLFQTNC